MLYKDEYTSGNDVRIDPSNPNIVYAALWEQQQSYIEGGGFGGAGNGIFKSTDGGTTWKQLTEGLPSIIQANLAIAPSNPRVVYAMVAGCGWWRRRAGRRRWRRHVGLLQVHRRRRTLVSRGERSARPASATQRRCDNRPLGAHRRRRPADDRRRSEERERDLQLARRCSGAPKTAALTWSAVRGAPGGDDYQKTWINPNNTDIILVVADQGGVVSANRGKSWSNWYNQPTAAMYHVSTDNAFPYRVCGGQQDSGSACVDSRSPDGMITFHDWHPVNIQEYGIAAPDPKDPDMVFGSQRSGVSLYNRKTGQTSSVGPDTSLRNQGFSRNVRTMPINWSPVEPRRALLRVERRVQDGRPRPQLDAHQRRPRRQTWGVPANAGKYASGVTPAPLGTITALSPSPKNINVIWAGTDDGNIQVTTDGGAKWTNVTPPQIKPWTRIFNIEAGHFDTLTAYAAANTLRLDDMNPHFWRTHDGGKTWTEINTGIAGGAVSNSIREDPRKKGLLYAATDMQVWVSFDDGDHWQSLKLDMPAISVRDMQVKDDSTCLCSDLVAGTHGRGFWILDNVTPLRQAAAAVAAGGNFSVQASDSRARSLCDE